MKFEVGKTYTIDEKKEVTIEEWQKKWLDVIFQITNVSESRISYKILDHPENFKDDDQRWFTVGSFLGLNLIEYKQNINNTYELW